MKGQEATRQTKTAAAKPGKSRAEQRNVCARPNGPAVSPGGGKRAQGAVAGNRPHKARIIDPRCLNLADAAAYCGLTRAKFSSHCPLGARIIAGTRLWDRRALDTWLDSIFGAAPMLSVSGGAVYDAERATTDALSAFNAATSNQKPGAGPKARQKASGGRQH
jgi:hypothetical protein